MQGPSFALPVLDHAFSPVDDDLLSSSQLTGIPIIEVSRREVFAKEKQSPINYQANRKLPVFPVK